MVFAFEQPMAADIRSPTCLALQAPPASLFVCGGICGGGAVLPCQKGSLVHAQPFETAPASGQSMSMLLLGADCVVAVSMKQSTAFSSPSFQS